MLGDGNLFNLLAKPPSSDDLKYQNGWFGIQDTFVTCLEIVGSCSLALNCQHSLTTYLVHTQWCMKCKWMNAKYVNDLMEYAYEWEA